MKKQEEEGVVLGVTGSIAAFKAATIAGMLVKKDIAVQVVMTPNATRFVQPLTYEAITNRPVHVEQFTARTSMEHIALARFAKVLVVAPATANFIGKYAWGVADDLLMTTAISVTCPVIVAPAMNGDMWRHPAVQENVAKLKERGVEFVGPVEGRLACGDEDVGRLAPEDDIVKAVLKKLKEA